MRVALAVSVFAVLGSMAGAQDAGSLADIRSELQVLNAQVRSLGAELQPSGGAASVPVSGDLLQRVDGLEAELTRLTAKTEALENRINRIVADGTNRIGDLEFRLLELEGGDLATLGETAPLGGDTAGPAPVSVPDEGGVEMAVSEQQDFERAQKILAAGDYAQAAAKFAAFNRAYPGGPLSTDAFFFQGEALEKSGAWNEAARAYLESFSGNPSSARAPQALLRLGLSLHELGQSSEACVMLQEVVSRYPGSSHAAQAQNSQQSINCL